MLRLWRSECSIVPSDAHVGNLRPWDGRTDDIEGSDLSFLRSPPLAPSLSRLTLLHREKSTENAFVNDPTGYLRFWDDRGENDDVEGSDLTCPLPLALSRLTLLPIVSTENAVVNAPVYNLWPRSH